MKSLYIILISMALPLLHACGGANNTANKADAQHREDKAVPSFNADSAYAYVKEQTSFGPRVPNTDAHKKCAEWLTNKLQEVGATNITVDTVKLTAYNGTKLDCRNITAQVNPQANKRILLLSHWDSRPWADQEKDKSLRDKPIDGANDGASGVGVILEIARTLAKSDMKAGIDILLVDAEDYGRRADEPTSDADEASWALGSQHWGENPTLDITKIRYGILLDMVGGKNAVFQREHFSEYAARGINDIVWKAAERAGYSDRFINSVGAPVIDDHIYMLKAGIPTIDIIETEHPETGSFNPTWHTHADNISNIDPNTLKAVGQTLTFLIYSE